MGDVGTIRTILIETAITRDWGDLAIEWDHNLGSKRVTNGKNLQLAPPDLESRQGGGLKGVNRTKAPSAVLSANRPRLAQFWDMEQAQNSVVAHALGVNVNRSASDSWEVQRKAVAARGSLLFAGYATGLGVQEPRRGRTV